MPADERVLSVVQGWVEKAESDLNNAAVVLATENERTADTVASHAQQCVQKYLKALLTYKGIDFPKAHDIGQLLVLLPQGTGVELPVPVRAVRTTTCLSTNAALTLSLLLASFVAV